MKRRIFKTLIALGSLALILFIAACNPNPSADDVEIGKIGKHSGTFYSNADAADTDLQQATSQTGEGMFAAEEDAVAKDLTIENQMKGLVDRAITELQKSPTPKTVETTYELSGDDSSLQATMTITEHTINGSDLGSGGSGTMNIPNYFIEITASGDQTSATANSWTEGSVNFVDFNNGTSSVTIEDGIINIGGRSSVNAAWNSAGTDIILSFDLFLAYKMGFALTNGTSGGRVILNIEFAHAESNISASSLSESAWSLDNFDTAKADLIVYDNNGDERYSKTYNGTEIFNLASDLNISGSFIY